MKWIEDVLTPYLEWRDGSLHQRDESVRFRDALAGRGATDLDRLPDENRRLYLALARSGRA